MVKPMRYRSLVALLREAGFSSRQGKGDHEVWSKGSQQVVITQTRDVSPGLVRNVLKAIEASKKEDQGS